ncbi:hypothetical protein BBR47_53930 [Brevibacillus brevis NBRC 100599]|uniref:Uncharacterized protein n=1 Tax=Brevibacillus brevis (strain 47 / JCM 6285 / NBRC 100599) TaxID=358681 RepID=C0Z721_BREBN|nr:hypothetical protein BBR47_29010 [Brevibacillus brevis NBRC 100599]BAH46370.1 hypothetical protein BBR47_53930 [Brevibacillus brevis NBRC 100599]
MSRWGKTVISKIVLADQGNDNRINGGQASLLIIIANVANMYT